MAALSGRWRSLLLTPIFTGLRASELRGLCSSDIDLGRRTIRVHQRADRFNDLGQPKSEAAERRVPIPPLVANALRSGALRMVDRSYDGTRKTNRSMRTPARSTSFSQTASGT